MPLLSNIKKNSDFELYSGVQRSTKPPLSAVFSSHIYLKSFKQHCDIFIYPYFKNYLWSISY